MKKLIATCAMTFAFAGTAWAQDEGDEEGGGDDMGGGMGDGMSGDDSGGGDTSGGGGDTGGGGDEGGGGGEHTMGISNTWPTGGDGGSANFLYAMGENWLDLQVGFNLDVVDDGTTSTTTVGIELLGGYRMYKDMKGRIHPYIEPGIGLSIGDFGDVGPTLSLLAYGEMGVDYALMDQFTLGTSLAAGLNFSNEFKDISFGLVTTSINATFWW